MKDKACFQCGSVIKCSPAVVYTEGFFSLLPSGMTRVGWGILLGGESLSWHSLSLFLLPFEACYPCLPLWASVFLCCLQRFRRMGSLSGATVSGWCGQDCWGAFRLQSCLKRAHWSEAHLAWKAAPSPAWS